MTTSDPAERVGDAERQSAIAALGVHWKDGRLDPAEHEARTTKAFAAVTRGDLDALFADLPADLGTAAVQDGRPAPLPVPGSPMPMTGSAPVPAQESGGGLFPRGSWVHAKRNAIMGVTPFAATGLFFATGGQFWWVWLAIPAMGAALYAGDDDDERRRGRDDKRERRRLDRGH